jgi:glutamine synthetase
MSASDVLKQIKDEDIKIISTFRFTDTRGKEQHVTVPTTVVDEDTFVRRENVRRFFSCWLERVSMNQT